MKSDVLPFLCCPHCRGDLTLTVDSEIAGFEGHPLSFSEVYNGSLTCGGKCGRVYPILEAVPLLLPPDVLAKREVAGG
mgnify:CR=1 FL=1